MNDEAYFQYLKSRSWRGRLYKRFYLYPRLNRLLQGRVLDVGAGIGDFVESRPNTVGVDVNVRTVAFCRERGLAVSVMAPDVLPFAQAEFDSVLLDNVLEHIAEPLPLLRECRRVLRAGGALVIGVPGRRGWDVDPDHKIFWDEQGLKALLAQAGLTLTDCFYTPLWKSEWLSRRLRQYCLYAAFKAD